MVVLSIVVLGGCTGSPVAETLTAPSKPSASAPAPAPTALPTAPTAAPEAERPLECADLLSRDALDSYARSGWLATDDLYERSAMSGGMIAHFVDYGGLLCQWGIPRTDATDIYGASPINAAQSKTHQAELVAQGWEMSEQFGGTVYQKERVEQSGHESFLFLDDHWFYITSELAAFTLLIDKMAA
ncbi:MAG: hypothetical protein JWM51_946 [Microbacteriaceae bacterium]|nr:hypothetical protein [Microbacteriaceae bacterium]